MSHFDEPRVKLVMRQPMLGSLILHLPCREVSTAELMAICGMPTAAVTIQKKGVHYRQELLYCKDFVEPLPNSQRQGLLAHEVMHLALGHCDPSRRGRRDMHRWNAACDYVVNLIVKDCGLELPPGGLIDEQYRSMTVEEVYEKLPANSKKCGCGGMTEIVILVENDGKPGGKGGKSAPSKSKPKKDEKKEEKEEEAKGPGQGDKKEKPADKGSPGEKTDTDPDAEPEEQGDGGPGHDDADPNEWELPDELDGSTEKDVPEEVKQKWKNLLVKAVMVAKSQGKCPAGLERMVDDLIQPKIPWQVLLQRLLGQIDRSDYDWRRGDRRFTGGISVRGPGGRVVRGPQVYLPSLYNEQADVVVAIDTSGSIGPKELKAFLSEIMGILRSKNVKKVRLMCCDAEVSLDEEIGPNDPLPTQLPGGGGTDFRPVFDRVAEKPEDLPKLLVYMTDLMGTFPAADEEPRYPVIWLSVNNQYEPPFGTRLDYELDAD